MKQENINNDVAIVGMACVFPKAPDLKTYWENIVSKVDAISDPPDDWDADRVFDPGSGANDRIYCKRGGYLGDLSRFDPLEFGIMPVAVNGAEPEHFMALKVAKEALTDAGFPDRPLNKAKTEVVLGRGTFVNRGYMTLLQHGFVVDQTIGVLSKLHPEYSRKELDKIKSDLKAGLPPFNAETAPGLAHNVMAGLIANRLDLNGANFVVDAACASCLIAIEIAMQDLITRKCDAVLTGGVQISTPSMIHMLFTQLGALSRHPQLRPFDSGADGTMLGEGIGMVVLKRLEDAKRDGHRIYAVIKGVGSSSDGRAKGLLAPRVEGEELALKRAYESTGISPETIGLIEAHGTAIRLGDATEIQSLSKVFGDREGETARCAIGTVKSMIGHLIPAAGIAGLIKTSLALYHKTLPPTLNCEEADPELEIGKTPFYINTETRPWIHASRDVPRRAGVNAFGFGGINAHAIVEEYRDPEESGSESCQYTWDSELCVLSGESRQELIKQCESVYAFLLSNPDAVLKDLAYTLNLSIKEKPYRLSVIASSIEEVMKKTEHALKKLKDPSCRKIQNKSGIYFFDEPLAPNGKVAFLFPGEGSQYTNMLADLCMYFPEARNCFDVLDNAFADHHRNFLPSNVIFPPPLTEKGEAAAEEGKLWRMDVAVDSVITADRAIFRLLDLFEVTPDCILGHSSGEFMAMEAAGAFDISSDQELVQHIIAGNKLIEKMTGTDKIPSAVLIAAGAADRKALSDIIEKSGGRVSIAMDNCPNQVVVCVEKDLIEETFDKIKDSGAICQRLPFERPYHTEMFGPACELLQEFFDKLEILPPRVQLYSCMTAGPMPDLPDEIRKLLVGQWAAQVRFRETIESMYDDGVRIFLEVGPGANLTGFVKDTLKKKPHVAVASNVSHRSGITQLHHALGLLAAHNVPMNLDHLYVRRSPKMLDLNETAERVVEKTLPKLSLALPVLDLEKSSDVHISRPVLRKGKDASDFVSTPAGDSLQITPAIRKAGGITRAGAGVEKFGKDGSALTTKRVIDDYLNSMEKFLDTQEEVMHSYLARNNGGLSAAGTEDKDGSAGDEKSVSRDRSSAMPFEGNTKKINDRSVISTYRLSPEKDIFLNHHTLGGRVAVSDESLLALPVMPFSMSLEVMAEAASKLCPGKILTEVQNVRSHRWIILEFEDLTLETTASVREGFNGNKVDVQLKAYKITASPEEQVVMDGTMVFGDQYPDSRKAGAFSYRSERKPDLSKEEFYPKALFHGPPLQSVKEINRIGDNGIDVLLEVPEKSGLFRNTPAPRMIADPIMIDAMGQAVGLWAASCLDQGFVVFPVSIDEIKFYSSPPGPAESFNCQIYSALDGESIINSDIETANTDGFLYVSIKGMKHKRIVNMPRIFHLFRGSRDVLLSTPCQKPIDDSSLEPAFECRKLDQIPADFWESDSGIWRTVLANIVLDRNEREEWSGMQCSEKRRTEWLIARTAGKEAVRELLRKRHGLNIFSADIRIDSDNYGKPVVSLNGLKFGGSAPLLSLSHTRGVCMAMASEKGEGCGIDVERISLRRNGIEGFTLNSEERGLLRSIIAVDDIEWPIRVWCAKEAIGKSLGRGLPGGPGDLVLRELAVDTGMVSLEISGSLARIFPHLKGKILKAHTVCDNDFIVATTILIKGK